MPDKHSSNKLTKASPISLTITFGVSVDFLFLSLMKCFTSGSNYMKVSLRNVTLQMIYLILLLKAIINIIIIIIIKQTSNLWI